jgi:hypothetical protein
MLPLQMEPSEPSGVYGQGRALSGVQLVAAAMAATEAMAVYERKGFIFNGSL